MSAKHDTEPIDVELFNRKTTSGDVELTRTAEKLLVTIGATGHDVIVELAEAREIYAALGEALQVADAQTGEAE